MFGIGMSEMLIVGVIALVLLGPDQIPDVARAVGRFLNELRRTTDDLKGSLTESVNIPTSIDELIRASNKENHVDLSPKYHEPTPANTQAVQTAVDSKAKDVEVKSAAAEKTEEPQIEGAKKGSES